MAPPRGQGRFLAGRCHCFLVARNGRSGLERDAEKDVLAVGDPALHAAGIVCGGPDPVIPNLERIVMLRAFHPRRAKAGPDLKTFRGRQTEHRLGEIGFQFVEDRLPETGRDAANDALDHAANRIAFRADGLNQRRH